MKSSIIEQHILALQKHSSTERRSDKEMILALYKVSEADTTRGNDMGVVFDGNLDESMNTIHQMMHKDKRLAKLITGAVKQYKQCKKMKKKLGMFNINEAEPLPSYWDALKDVLLDKFKTQNNGSQSNHQR